MKFRYYITNTFQGRIEGSNDEQLVRELAQCSEYFIVDSHTGKWLTDDSDVEIEEQ